MYHPHLGGLKDCATEYGGGNFYAVSAEADADAAGIDESDCPAQAAVVL